MGKNEDSLKSKSFLNLTQINWQRINFIFLVFLLGVKTFFCILLFIHNHIQLFFVFFISTVICFYSLLINSIKALILYIVILTVVLGSLYLSFYNVINLEYVPNIFKEEILSYVLYSVTPFLIIEFFAAITYISLKKKKKSYIEKTLKELKIIVDEEKGEKKEKIDEIISLQIDLKKNELNTCNNNYKYYLTQYKNKKYICIEKKIDYTSDENDFILDLEDFDNKSKSLNEKGTHKKKSYKQKGSIYEVSEDLSFIHCGIKKYEKKKELNSKIKKLNKKEKRQTYFDKSVKSDSIQNENSTDEHTVNVHIKNKENVNQSMKSEDDKNGYTENEDAKNEKDNSIEQEQTKKGIHTNEQFIFNINKESQSITSSSMNLKEKQCEETIKKNSSNNRYCLTVTEYQEKPIGNFNSSVPESAKDFIDYNTRINEDSENIISECLKQKMDILENNEEENCIIEDFIGKSTEEFKKEEDIPVTVNSISEENNKKQILEIETGQDIHEQEHLIENNREEIIKEKKEESKKNIDSLNKRKKSEKKDEKDIMINVYLLDNNSVMQKDKKEYDKKNLQELKNATITKKETQVKNPLIDEREIQKERNLKIKMNEQRDTKNILIDKEYDTNLPTILSDNNKEKTNFSNVIINRENNNNLNNNKTDKKLDNNKNLINDELNFDIKSNSEGKTTSNNNNINKEEECNKLNSEEKSSTYKNMYEDYKIFDLLKKKTFKKYERYLVNTSYKEEKEGEHEKENINYLDTIEKNEDTHAKKENKGGEYFESSSNLDSTDNLKLKNNDNMNDEYKNEGSNMINSKIELKVNEKSVNLGSNDIPITIETIKNIQEEELQKNWKKIDKKDIEKLKESVNVDNIEDIQIDFYKKNKKGVDINWSAVSINSSNLSNFLKIEKEENEGKKEKGENGEIINDEIYNKKEMNDFKINSLDNICLDSDNKQNNNINNSQKEKYKECSINDMINKKSKDISTQDIPYDQPKFNLNNSNYRSKSNERIQKDKNNKENEYNNKSAESIENNSNPFYFSVNSLANTDYRNYEDIIKNNSKITDIFLCNRTYKENNKNDEMNPVSVDSLNNNIYNSIKNKGDSNAINIDGSSVLNSSFIAVRDSNLMNESNETNYLNTINDSNNNHKNSFIYNYNDNESYCELNSNVIFQKRKTYFENLDKEKSSNSIQRKIEYNEEKDNIKEDDNSNNNNSNNNNNTHELNSDPSLNLYRKRNYLIEKKKNQHYKSKDENEMQYQIEKFAKLKKTNNINNNYYIINDKIKSKSLNKNGRKIENEEAILSNESSTKNIYNMKENGKDKKVEVTNDFESKKKKTQHFVIYDQSDISSSRKTGEHIKSNEVFDFDKKNDFEIVNFSKIKLNNSAFGSNFRLKSDNENNFKKSFMTNRDIINNSFTTDIVHNPYFYVNKNKNNVINHIINGADKTKGSLFEDKKKLASLVRDNQNNIIKKKKLTELKKKNKLTNNFFNEINSNEINFNAIKNCNHSASYNQLNVTNVNDLNGRIFRKNVNLISSSSFNDFGYNDKKSFPNSNEFIKCKNEEFKINSKTDQVTSNGKIDPINLYEVDEEKSDINRDNDKINKNENGLRDEKDEVIDKEEKNEIVKEQEEKQEQEKEEKEEEEIEEKEKERENEEKEEKEKVEAKEEEEEEEKEEKEKERENEEKEEEEEEEEKEEKEKERENEEKEKVEAKEEEEEEEEVEKEEKEKEGENEEKEKVEAKEEEEKEEKEKEGENDEKEKVEAKEAKEEKEEKEEEEGRENVEAKEEEEEVEKGEKEKEGENEEKEKVEAKEEKEEEEEKENVEAKEEKEKEGEKEEKEKEEEKDEIIDEEKKEIESNENDKTVRKFNNESEKNEKEIIENKECIEKNSNLKRRQNETDDVNKENNQITINKVLKNVNNVKAKAKEEGVSKAQNFGNTSDYKKGKEAVDSVNEVLEGISLTQEKEKNCPIESNNENCELSNISKNDTQADNVYTDDNQKKEENIRDTLNEKKNLNSNTNKDTEKIIYDNKNYNILNSDIDAHNNNVNSENNITDQFKKNGEIIECIMDTEKNEKQEFVTCLDNINDTKKNAMSTYNLQNNEQDGIKEESIKDTNLKKLNSYEEINGTNEKNKLCFSDEEINCEEVLNENSYKESVVNVIDKSNEDVDEPSVHKNSDGLNKSRDKKKNKRKRNKKNKER